jgi:hypothetical protein
MPASGPFSDMLSVPENVPVIGGEAEMTRVGGDFAF